MPSLGPPLSPSLHIFTNHKLPEPVLFAFDGGFLTQSTLIKSPATGVSAQPQRWGWGNHRVGSLRGPPLSLAAFLVAHEQKPRVVGRGMAGILRYFYQS